jgi:hypothetical protein
VSWGIQLERSQRRLLTSIGGIASAATGGALVAMGRRLGSAAVPFAGIGAAVAHRTVDGRAAALVVLGIIVHVLVTFGWSVAFLSFVRHIGRPVVGAIAIAVCAFLLSQIVTIVTGRGVASVLALGDRLVLGAIFAAALVLGMRFAFFPARDAADTPS